MDVTVKYLFITLFNYLNFYNFQMLASKKVFVVLLLSSCGIDQ